MATFTFIGDIPPDHEFFRGMHNEIVRAVNEPGKMFDHFRGTFEIKMDKLCPRAEYRKIPTEDVDEGLLKSYLFLLNYTLISFTLKNRQKVQI
jgi:hypothetical protein